MDSYRQVWNKVISLNFQFKEEYYNKKISACKGNINKLEQSLSILDKEGNNVILFGDKNCDSAEKPGFSLDSNVKKLSSISELFIYSSILQNQLGSLQNVLLLSIILLCC